MATTPDSTAPSLPLSTVSLLPFLIAQIIFIYKQSLANKGLKKKVLRSLPKLTAIAESAVKFSDCSICLSEFAACEEIRVLPQCGHGFHLRCIDAWLKSHSSCPSCHQILVVSRQSLANFS